MTLESPPVVASRSSIDRVWEALDRGGFKPEKRADKFMALCPVHGDQHRSLSVRWDSGREATLLHCFSCDASIHDITGALGLTVSDTFDRPLPPREDRPARGRREVRFNPPHKVPARITQPSVVDDELRGATWQRVTTYDYADVDGTIVQQVYREQALVAGVTHKRFTQRFRNASTGRMVNRKPEGFKPVLYRHRDVVNAIAAGRPVWLVEGEKDADNAAAIGLVATTNAQGAGSFPEELAAVLAGGTVNIVADQDTAGYKRAAALHELLTGVGATVRILLPAVDDDKADLTDHLEAGLGVEQLAEISAEDAAVLARLGEARKALAGVRVCLEEIEAHRAAAAGDANPQHLLDIESWAHESEIRYRRLLEQAGGSTLIVDVYGPRGRAAVDGIRDVVDQAAEAAGQAHDLAGIPAPTSITERLKRRDQPRTLDVGSGSEPPVFRGDQFIRGDDGKDPNVGVEYLVRKGETVQLKRERDGDGWRNRYHRILRGWAEVQSLAVDDDGTGNPNSRATHQMVVKFFRWVRDDAGQPIPDEEGQPKVESELVTWDADQLRDGSWVQSLPWPGMLESTSRRGKDTAWDAIFNARPVPSTRTTVYVASGWRESDAGPFFVHAGGAIAKGGTVPVATDLPHTFSPFNLPEPLTEPAQLREAWDAGTVPLVENLPARVMAPLLGVVWQSVFERVPFITHLVGGRAAYKTSTARLACQFFAPELHFRGRREILSGANMGGTTIGLVRALSITNHLPVLIDDVAPDGNAKKAQEKLSQLARLIYNDTGRVVGRQRGGIATDEPTKATVITTGELAVTGSAQTRMLSIPLDPGSLARGSETFAELERTASRTARGQLGASLIRWIAQNRDGLKAEAESFGDKPNDAAASLTRWRKRLANLPHDAGLKDRLTEAAMTADHGIRLMLRMMRTSGALTTEETNEFYAWAEQGIYEAIAMQDSAAGDPADQLLGYLREALAAGAGHLTVDGGELPENPGGVGWAVKGSGDYATWQPNGPRVGMIKGDRVYLIPSTTIGVANAIAGRADETFAETSVSISSALTARGWLAVDGSGKRSVGRRIDGALLRVWDMPLNVLLGDDDTPDTGDQEHPPTPNPPLFDDIHPGGASPQPDDAPEGLHEDDGATAASEAPSDPQKPRGTAPAAPGASKPAKAAASPFRAAAAVLHTDGVWLPDGEHIELTKPIEHLGDVAKLVTTLRLGHKNGWKSEDGQLYVTADAAIALGIPVDQLPKYKTVEALKEITVDHPLILGALEAGYEVGGKERSLNATTRVWHPDNRELRGRFVIIPALGSDFAHLVDDDPDPVTLARRLQRFADALGAPYAISASTTGLDLMQVLHWKQRELYFAPSKPVPPAEIATLEADIDWQRPPSEQETGHRWVHAYDRGGSYLAGVSGLELGIGAPTYHPDGHEFDHRLPGYWRIAMPERAEWLWPNPLDPRNRDNDIAGELTWVTTPTLDVARTFGYEPEILEAYVWEQHSRIYDTWYERVRDARTTLDTGDPDDSRAREVLKELYVRTLGLTASFTHHQGRPGFAPERYHAIQARARANILRRIQQIGNDTGRWPIAIWKDTVLYTSDETDPIAAWPGRPEHLGRGLGQYKYEGTAPLEQHRRFLTGKGKYDGIGELEELL